MNIVLRALPVGFIFVKNNDSLPRLTPIGVPFVEIGTVDSSNNYAMRQIQAQMAEHGTVYFAHYQTNGKGQRGKNWNAQPGDNITFSCVLVPDTLSIDNKFVISACIALACYDLCTALVKDNISIKWPNDIYWKDRKAGGILIENVLQGKDWKYAVAGIGLNINQTLFSDEIFNPVSIKQITGKDYDPITLAKELCQYLNVRWSMMLNGKQNQLIQEYIGHLYKLNEMTTFKVDDTCFTAKVRGVNKQGELIIDNGKESAIPHGTVEWVLQPPKHI